MQRLNTDGVQVFNRTFKHNITTPAKKNGRYKCLVVNELKYLTPRKRGFCSAEQMLEAVEFKGREYRRIPEFPDYYVARNGIILSTRTGNLRLLTPQFLIKNRSDPEASVYGPVARIRDASGNYRTRSVAKIVTNLWEDTK